MSSRGGNEVSVEERVKERGRNESEGCVVLFESSIYKPFMTAHIQPCDLEGG